MIPVSRPSIGAEELNALRSVFESGWLGLGSTVLEFENRLKDFLNAKNIIAVNTGTSALHIALDSFGVKAGDEVIVPSLTFCASIQAITTLGAIPVFCDVDYDTLNIDIEDVKRKITSKTKAIMPVHFAGNACDMDKLLEIDIPIVEDAAHAFGSSYKGKKIGSFGYATCFSFDPIKNITCGEGGAISVSNNDITEKIRRKRILGIDKDTWNRYKESRSWTYEVSEQGYRYHMSNINATIGIEQLKKFDMFVVRKNAIRETYDNVFNETKRLIPLRYNNETVPFIYVVRVPNGERDNLMRYLHSSGIDAGVHYIPNHLQPFFSKYRTELPITERLYDELLTLPFYCDMSIKEILIVLNSIESFFW